MTRDEIFAASLRHFLAPVQEFLEDPTVTEVMINGPGEVYIERSGRLLRTDRQFAGEHALRAAVNNIAQFVGREIDADRPILDARLPDGSRVHVVIPPGARGGTTLTIRRFRRDMLSMDDLVRQNSLSPDAAEFLSLCVQLRKNILVAGGAGTGKTTILNALSTAIPDDERVVVIEDSSELKLAQPHTVYLESQTPDAQGRNGVTIRQLFTASLRMRPDRVIVGEVRGGEALDMIQSMLSGHSGSLTTIHASTPRDALVRLETLALMSDVDLPVHIARAQAAAAVHVVVQLARFVADGRRRVVRITEQCGLDAADRYTFRDLFTLAAHQGSDAAPSTGGAPRGAAAAAGAPGAREETRWDVLELSASGARPSFAAELHELGLADRARLTSRLWAD